MTDVDTQFAIAFPAVIIGVFGGCLLIVKLTNWVINKFQGEE